MIGIRVPRFIAALTAFAVAAGCYQEKPKTASAPPADASPSIAPAPSSDPQALAPTPADTTAPRSTGATPAPDAPGAPETPAALSPGNDTTLSAIMQFRLTTAELERWGKAQHALNKTVAGDPTIAKRMARATPPRSLDDVVARFSSEPKIRQALASANVTPREYVTTLFALQQAMQGYAQEKAGQTPGPGTPEVLKENVAFVDHNMPAISKMMAELRADAPAGAAPSPMPAP